MAIKAVLWDFGGVITTSPFEAFARFERAHGYPEGFIRTVNATRPDTNAWARFERSEIGPAEFDRAFEEEARALGHAIRGSAVLALLGGDLRPEMVEAVRRCKQHFKTACLTNNFLPTPERADDPQAAQAGGGEPAPSRMAAVREWFDVVIESSRIGVRKPDPQFYAHALEAVAVRPEEAVFLDDLGVNLKPARSLGMHTIKVHSAEQALGELEPLVGIPLRGPSASPERR